jgi:gliding motility-associated-like protein
LSVAPSPAPSDILYNVTPTNCGTNNGSISITQVTGGQSPFTYSFNGQQSFGNTQDTISLANQNYLIAVKDVNNCVYQEIVAIPEIPGPNDILSLDTNPTCGLNNGSISLLSIVGGVTPFSYQFDSQVLSDTIISNLLAGSYLIQVTDIFGCSFQKNINLIDEAGISSIFIPNVFTPNEDNLNTNEYWKVEATCIKSVKGIILNRWGDKVFEFDELFDSWDGTTKSGESVKDGVYYYEVEFTYFDEKAEIFHGHITVIR